MNKAHVWVDAKSPLLDVTERIPTESNNYNIYITEKQQEQWFCVVLNNKNKQPFLAVP